MYNTLSLRSKPTLLFRVITRIQSHTLAHTHTHARAYIYVHAISLMPLFNQSNGFDYYAIIIIPAVN